jgi:hypothetical protein
MWPSYISRIHKEIGDGLGDSIGGIKAKNININEKIKELKETFMPLPLVSIPLEIIRPITPTTRIKGS